VVKGEGNVTGGEPSPDLVPVAPLVHDRLSSTEIVLDLLRRSGRDLRVHPCSNRREDTLELDRELGQDRRAD
jgi:hypothetical protein